MTHKPSIEVRLRLQKPSFSLTAEITHNHSSIMTLQGPSGTGKTLLLRAFAGLEIAQHGYIRINKTIWQDRKTFLPSHKRHIGYVPQGDSLFPHLTVRQNILFGASVSSEISDELATFLSILEIETLLDKKPSGLSGGERQRVALARAFATRPHMFLLDEPLSALDMGRKKNILPYMQQQFNKWQCPVLYVTHDLTEVEALEGVNMMIQNGVIQYL